MSKQQDNPVEGQTSTSKCPVDHAAYAHFLPNSKTDGVAEGQDKESLNPANYMPAPNQERADNQRMSLDTQRELSTIPMAAPTHASDGASNSGENACPAATGDNKHGVWVYPSQQMFFNALRRKNWNPNEEDMQTVVPIHNAVNERAWKEILKWEHMHESDCGRPALVRFQGRPQDISLKARLRSWLGYKLPFDRHDWVVDRCGEEVTYIIDFYAGQHDPKRPEAVASFYLDVRPAPTFTGLIDRARFLFRQLTSD
ncbi:cytochrome c/c1 heme-lyase [Syncephalis plumigaleata]|nr:cytochrome c/c1 heme-lyase [Syncephalis plumigaleata]